jgi:putative transposase
MVSHPREYRWSSYRTNAEGVRSDLIKPHDLYRTLGCGEQARRDAYRALFQDQDMGAVNEIQLATNGGFVLGGERFRSEIERVAGRRVVPGKAGRPARKIGVRP